MSGQSAKETPQFAILHYSCPPVIGGVEFIIEAHARLLAELGYRPRVIVGQGGKLDPRVRTEVIPEMASGGGDASGVVTALRGGEVPTGFDGAVKKLERRLSKALRGVDVCMIHNVMTMHFNLVLTAALARLMARPRRTRFIAWTHDAAFVDPDYADHQRPEYPWNLLSKAAPGCDYCVISAQRQRELAKLFGIGKSRLPIIPDGIDVRDLLGLTPPVREIFHGERLYRKEFVALTPTRIVPRKRLEVGMEIVAAIKRRRKKVFWMITGAPDPHNPDSVQYFDELRTMRRRFRLEKEVHFLCERFGGRVGHDDLRGLYGISDVLLFPSEREGFGIPVLEAGITGLLVVMSYIPALRELGRRDTVYIRPRETADAVADRTIRAFERSRRLMFRRRIIGTYSWDAVFADKIMPALTQPDRVWKKGRSGRGGR